MDTNFPSTRQWIIRQIPWLAILVFIAMFIAVIGIMIFNEEARCGASVLLLIFLVSIFAFEMVTCILDLDRRMVTLERTQVWRKTKQEFSFDEVNTVSVQSSSDPDSTTYNVVFVLNSGVIVPLTKYTSSGKRSKEKLVHNIIAYMNQTHSTSINESLDGEIHVEQQGETDGIPWKIAFVAGNDKLPQTRWQSTRPQLDNGFILLIPTSGVKTGTMPGGVFGAAVRMIYGQYLRMLDISESDLPDFDKAQILPGDHVGLNKRFTILTNDPYTAKTWLTGERVRQLVIWTQTNPLKANNAASDPHLVVTPHGLRITFRGKFNQVEQIAAIAHLGASLSER